MAMRCLLAILLLWLPCVAQGAATTPWLINLYTNTTDLAAHASPLNNYKIMAVGNLDGAQLYMATNTVTGTNTTTRIASVLDPTSSWQLLASMSTSNVLTSRAVNTSAPLAGGGTLASDLTLSIPVATAIAGGYLSSNDWSTFNGKSSFTGTSGTVINTGTPAVGNVPAYSDTTGTNVAPSSALTLTGTNAALKGNLTANGGAFTNSLTIGGVAVSTFTGTSGTVINSGTPAVGNVPTYSNTTGTNIAPSSALTLTGTNAALTGNLTANGGAFTNALTLGGVAVSTATGANPSASVGLSAVNGSAATWMRSDGAPALSQSIGPTWTGAHIFNASSGVPVTITPGAANTSGLVFNGFSLTGSSAVTGIDLSGTWNTSGAPDFLSVNVTNTASNANANLFNFKASGASKLSLSPSGTLTQNGNYVTTGTIFVGGYILITGSGGFHATGNGIMEFVDTAGTGFTSLSLGPDDATANDGTLKGASGVGTDKDGGKIIVAGGKSTGTGRGGALVGQTSPSSTTGSSANSYSTRSYFSAKEAALTESSATLFANITVAASKAFGATVNCTLMANDASDFQVLRSVLDVSAVNKGGTATVALVQTDKTQPSFTGTLSCTYTAVVNGNSIDLKANAVSSLTQTRLGVIWSAEIDGDAVATVTPQ